MRSFTIEVYSCEQCPHADHDEGMCLEEIKLQLEQDYPNDFWLDNAHRKARSIYSKNCMELCDSCPRVHYAATL